MILYSVLTICEDFYPRYIGGNFWSSSLHCRRDIKNGIWWESTSWIFQKRNERLPKIVHDKAAAQWAALCLILIKEFEITSLLSWLKSLCKKIYTIEFYLHMYIARCSLHSIFKNWFIVCIVSIPICEDQVLSSIQFYSQTIN